MSKPTTVLLVAASVLLIFVLVLTQTKICTENYDATYAYQFNKYPRWLSRFNATRGPREAQFHNVCNARVAAQCRGLPYVSRVGCVLQNLEQCKRLNGL